MTENRINEANVLSPERLDESKVVLLVRHGEVDVAPEDKIYNRDEHMSGHIVHISNKGRGGLLKLVEKIHKVGLHPKIMWVSPQIRAKESANVLNTILNLSPEQIIISEEINELDFPNAYMAGVQMKDLQRLFDDNEWMAQIGKLYPAESYESLSKRMLRTFDAMKTELKVGESGIMLSHGDPIAVLTNKLLDPDKEIQSPQELRTSMYCPKGNAIVVGMDQDNTIFDISYLLPKEDSKVY